MTLLSARSAGLANAPGEPALRRNATVFLAVVALAGCLGLTGCSTNSLPESLGGAGVSAQNEMEKVQFSEIDDAAGKGFDKDKVKSFVVVAKQTDLTPNAQVYLVYKTSKAIDFDENRIPVLRALIRNPGFCEAAKKSIKKHLGEFMFEEARSQLRQELDQRGEPLP